MREKWLPYVERVVLGPDQPRREASVNAGLNGPRKSGTTPGCKHLLACNSHVILLLLFWGLGWRHTEVKFAVVVEFREVMGIITGRAPPSHEPIHNTPRRAKCPHMREATRGLRNIQHKAEAHKNNNKKNPTADKHGLQSSAWLTVRAGWPSAAKCV